MSGNVSAGSILNQRVFTRQNRTAGSGGNGGGVRRNTLAQARVIIGANRTRIGGARASYTQLSNMINGRKEVIYAGGHSCGSCSGEMSTMQKVGAYMAIAQQGLTLAQGLKQLFASPKATQSGNAGGTGGTGSASGAGGAGGANGTRSANGNSSISTLNNSSLTTIGQDNYSLGSTDLSTTLDLINIDYDGGADKFIDAMNDAENSQDLYQALMGAKAYKAQIDARIASIDIDKLNDDLTKLKGDAEGSVSAAEKNVHTLESSTKEAAQGLSTAERNLDVADQRYQGHKDRLCELNAEFKNVCELEKTAEQEYEQAGKDVAAAKTNLKNANTAYNACQRNTSNAKLNLSQAEENLYALQAQANTSNSAALQLQIDAAQQAVNNAKSKVKDAEQAEQDAMDALVDARDQLNTAELTETAKKNLLSQARVNTKQKAQELFNANENDKQYFADFEVAQNNVITCEGNLETAERAFTSQNDKLARAQEELAELVNQQEQLEMQIADYKEMKEAAEDLKDLSKYEKKLNRMLEKEGTKVEDLRERRADKDEISNDQSVSNRRRERAERAEARIDQRLRGIYDGSALDDIARDAALPGGARWESAGTLSVNDDNGSGNDNDGSSTPAVGRVGDTGLSTVTGIVAAGQQARMGHNDFDGLDRFHRPNLGMMYDNRSV